MNQDQGNDNPASAPQVNANDESAARPSPRKGPATTVAPGPQALGASSLVPVKRGRGRPKGSKNREKGPTTPNQPNIPSAKSGSELAATTASKQPQDSGGQFAANPLKSLAAPEQKDLPRQPQQLKQNQVALKEPRYRPPIRGSGVLDGPGLQPPRVPSASLPPPGSQSSHQLFSKTSTQNRFPPSADRLTALPTPFLVNINPELGKDSDWVKEQVRLAIEQWLFIGREPPEAAIWAALKEARRNEDERLQALNAENPQPLPWWTIAQNYDEDYLYLLQARVQHPENRPGQADEYVTFDPKQVEAQRKKEPNWLIGKIGERLVAKPERLQNNPKWLKEMVEKIRSAANRPVFDLPNPVINPSGYPAQPQALREAEAVVPVDVGASQNLPKAWSDRQNQDIWNFRDHLRNDIPPRVPHQILDNNSFKKHPEIQLRTAAMRPEDVAKELADAYRADRDSDVIKLREFLHQNLPPVLLRQVLSPPTPNPLRPIHLPSTDVLPVPDPRELAEAFTADNKETLFRLREHLVNTLSPAELEKVLSPPGFDLPVPQPAKSPEPAKIEKDPQPGSWTSETDFHHFYAPFPYEDYDKLDNQGQEGGESLTATQSPSNSKEDGDNGNETEPGNRNGTNIVNTITRDDDGETIIGSIERDETGTAIDSAIEQGHDDTELDDIFGEIMADIDRDEDYNAFISSIARPPDELGRPSEEALKSAKKAVPKSLVGVKRSFDSFQNQVLSKAEVVGDIVYFSGPPIPPPPSRLSRLSRLPHLPRKPPHHAQKPLHLPRQALSPSAMDSRITASQNEDEVKLLGREYLYLRQLSRPPHDGLGQHQILRMNVLITRLNEIDPTIVPWLNQDQADRRGTAPSQLVLDLDYDPLSGNLTAEQEAREARRCMAAVRLIFPGLYQSLKTGEKYCGEGFVESYGSTANQGEEAFDGFCSGKQVDTTAGDNRMMLDNTANNARLQSDRGYLHAEAARDTFKEGLASKRQKLTENNNALAVDGNSALQQAPVDLSSSSQIIEHAASTSEQALLLVSSIVPLPDSSTTSAPKQTPTPTLDAKAIPAILENSPQELQQKLAPAMSTASNSVVLDAFVPRTTSNTGEISIISDKPVESPQRSFVKNSHTKNASASIGDPSARPSQSATTSVKQTSSFSTPEISTAMDICEPESMMKISAAGSAMELSDEEGEIKEDVACPPLMSPASLGQKNSNNIPRKHPTKEVFAVVQQRDNNINMEPRRRYFSRFEYPPNGPSAYSWGVARHWGARPPPGAYRPDDVVFAVGTTASGSGPSTSPSRNASDDPPPPPSYPPPPPPPPAASHSIVPRPAAQQHNGIMPAGVGGSSIPFDHRMQAVIRDPTLSSLPPVPANLPPRPANRAATPPRAARGLMPGLADPDSPTPSRTPGGKLHCPSRPLSQPRPRPRPSRPSQQVDGPISIDWNGSLHFEYVILKMYSRNQRDEAATRLQRLIEDDLAYGLLKIVSLPDDKSIKVSGPQGFRTRDNLVRLFPEAKGFAHATN